MHNKLDDLKNKKFDIKQMVGSFFGGVLVTVLVVYGSGFAGSQGQGYLRSVTATPSLNPAAISDASKKPIGSIPSGTCNVSNCDINAKLDLILNQVTIKNGGSQTLAAYIADQFTDTRNGISFLAGQFSESDNMLTQIQNTVQTINNYFLPGTFTDMMNKLDALHNDAQGISNYMPPVFTDIMNKLNQIIAK